MFLFSFADWMICDWMHNKNTTANSFIYISVCTKLLHIPRLKLYYTIKFIIQYWVEDRRVKRRWSHLSTWCQEGNYYQFKYIHCVDELIMNPIKFKFFWVYQSAWLSFAHFHSPRIQLAEPWQSTGWEQRPKFGNHNCFWTNVEAICTKTNMRWLSWIVRSKVRLITLWLYGMPVRLKINIK